jgi:hypothetical protein
MTHLWFCCLFKVIHTLNFIKSKLGDLNYVVKTPDRQKKARVCHVNILKAYYERKAVPVVVANIEVEENQ